MKRRCAAACGAMALTSPVLAQSGMPEMTTGTRAIQAARQPAEDLNIMRDRIAAKLLAVQDDPYRLDGITACDHVAIEINELNLVLGPDVDAPPAAKRKAWDSLIEVGGGMLAGLMPFRGIVREVTGANAAKRRHQAAIYAGVTRRSFLKGVGVTMGCPAPAAPTGSGPSAPAGVAAGAPPLPARAPVSAIRPISSDELDRYARNED